MKQVQPLKQTGMSSLKDCYFTFTNSLALLDYDSKRNWSESIEEVPHKNFVKTGKNEQCYQQVISKRLNCIIGILGRLAHGNEVKLDSSVDLRQLIDSIRDNLTTPEFHSNLVLAEMTKVTRFLAVVAYCFSELVGLSQQQNHLIAN